MEKRKKMNGKGTSVYFEMLRHKSDGKQWVIYLCRRCSRAWKYADPVEAWKVNGLLTHAGTHQVDAMVTERLATALPDRVED